LRRQGLWHPIVDQIRQAPRQVHAGLRVIRDT
jgi:hypothetical protein